MPVVTTTAVPVVANPHFGCDSTNRISFHKQIFNRCLLYIEIWFALNHPLQPELIRLLIALRARSPNRRPLLCIEHSKLNPRLIGVDSHLATECIDFPGKVSFCKAANGRIAGHLPDRVEIGGKQQSLAANASARQCCFSAGMTGTYNNYIIPFGICEHTVLLPDAKSAEDAFENIVCGGLSGNFTNGIQGDAQFLRNNLERLVSL